MPWIRKNLAFVISLSVALLLLIAGTVYLFVAQEDADLANGGLEAKKTEYDALVSGNPSPMSKILNWPRLNRNASRNLSSRRARLFQRLLSLKPSTMPLSNHCSLEPLQIWSRKQIARESSCRLELGPAQSTVLPSILNARS